MAGAELNNGEIRGREFPEISDKYLSVKELSELLGISVATIYRLTEGRKLPYLRIGGQIRFRKQSIDAWARQSEKEPLEP